MVEVYGQVSTDGARWAALIVAAAVLAGCGSVELEAGDAGADAGLEVAGDAQAAAGAGGIAGGTGAAGSSGAAGTGAGTAGAGGASSPDAGDGAPPSSCSAATYRDVCVNYTDRRACLVGCKGSDGKAWPQSGTSCTGTVPFFDDVIPVCVSSCADCPREL